MTDSPRQSASILVLDDDPNVAAALGRDVRKAGPVVTFTKGVEALNALAQDEFSVVLSDLQMPDMNGIEFLTHCAQLKPDTQRILITAYADLVSLADSINKARINLLLTKPWEPADLLSAVGSAQRQYDMLRENAALRKMALTDALTGVSNHRYFWERLESELSRAQRYERSLCLIMCDVDNFKKFNDTHGHLHGDQILRQVAQSLESTRRSMDTVARYGGEEFAIILPEATRAQAVEIAKRHLETMTTRHGITASFGVAAFPEDARTPTELVHSADSALLRAKAAGKSRVFSAKDA